MLKTFPARAIGGLVLGRERAGRLADVDLSDVRHDAQLLSRRDAEHRLADGVPGDELRALLRGFPAGVAVLTVDAEGERLGLTVGTVVSLSLEPPLVGRLRQPRRPPCTSSCATRAASR